MVSIKNMAGNRRWVPILIVALTALFRLWYLAIKPPHFDEGVNGWFLDEMTRQGYYSYDPANYHGPLHFYYLFLFKVLFGRNLWALRVPVVLVSVLTVYLVTQFDRFLDRRTCWIAAIAMAVSPGFEFYGRYAIHESEMVFFLILTVWGALGIWKGGTITGLWAAALGATGMILTKETYVIHFTAFLLAFACVLVFELIRPSPGFKPIAAPPYPLADLISVGAVCAGLIIFFYSGAFLDFPALSGLYKTFGEWVKTGQNGNGHEKAWSYWFTLVQQYEWPTLIGMAVSFFYLWPKENRFIRYIMIYGWGTLVAYSIVHYKTPWCIITLIWPFFFVFGEFVKDLADLISENGPGRTGKVAVYGLFSLLLCSSFIWSTRLSFAHYTDESEPYVYVQTFPDVYKLVDPVLALAAKDPSNYHLKGNIIVSSYHPLPWMLGDFTNVGYYDDEKEVPENKDADFLFIDGDRVDEVEKGLKDEYFTDDLRLRGSMDPGKLYLSAKKFAPLFPGRKPEFVPGQQPPKAEPVKPESEDDNQ